MRQAPRCSACDFLWSAEFVTKCAAAAPMPAAAPQIIANAWPPGVGEVVRAPAVNGEPPETPHPHDATCTGCGTRLMFSARRRGDGLCGPCSSAAIGTHPLADRCRDAGIELSLVLEIMRSPGRRAALRAVLAGPPFDAVPDGALRPGDTWRDSEGTEYVVVLAGEVGNRPRWLIGERTTPHHLSGLRTRGDLHRKPPVYHPYVLVERYQAVEVDVPAGAAPPGSVGIAFAAYLASAEGRATIAECMRRPPVRMADGTWREPTPGSEAKPGDVVRFRDGQTCGVVCEAGGDGHAGELGIERDGERFVVVRSAVEVIVPAEQGRARPQPLAYWTQQARPPRTGYRDDAGNYHPGPDALGYEGHANGCPPCAAERDAGRKRSGL